MLRALMVSCHLECTRMVSHSFKGAWERWVEYSPQGEKVLCANLRPLKSNLGTEL